MKSTMKNEKAKPTIAFCAFEKRKKHRTRNGLNNRMNQNNFDLNNFESSFD